MTTPITDAETKSQFDANCGITENINKIFGPSVEFAECSDIVYSNSGIIRVTEPKIPTPDNSSTQTIYRIKPDGEDVFVIDQQLCINDECGEFFNTTGPYIINARHFKTAKEYLKDNKRTYQEERTFSPVGN